ncbi:uncharacterized protein DUF4383 [Rhodoglobus vestalii]|uniref:Uncharacterized protein DUF4383 n=1 Tax=Rhodoglobus vestalii TaxID=193384 RepID=A0A8H2K760_9MICO|nr:DUF4383 domain-containing protein [Rhodoglobus vestalii]TQO20088.1 uncharacterized protein DUF4383 [Rhodoglobus vestalii]
MTASPNRLWGTIVGAAYILVGMLGFTVTGDVDFFATEGGLFLGLFEVNVFQNVAHILIGSALLLAAFSNPRAARTVNTTVGVGFLLLGFAGLLLVGSPFNFLALNAADNVVHLGSAVILLAVGLGADKLSAA